MSGKYNEDSMFYGASSYLFEYAKRLRKAPTEAEALLWNVLNKKQLGIKFRRQHPIYNYIADFYCHELKLVIEVDGKYHNEQKEYDRYRSNDLTEFGIKVVRFTNDQVLNDIENVLNIIKQEIFLLKKS
jgi:cyclase